MPRNVIYIAVSKFAWEGLKNAVNEKRNKVTPSIKKSSI